jgi:hypothetical protein
MTSHAYSFLLSFGISCVIFWFAAWYIAIPSFVHPYIERWKRRRLLRGGRWKEMKESLDNLNRLLDDIERDINDDHAKR